MASLYMHSTLHMDIRRAKNKLGERSKLFAVWDIVRAFSPRLRSALSPPPLPTHPTHALYFSPPYIACSLMSNQSEKCRPARSLWKPWFNGWYQPRAMEIVRRALIKVYYNKTYWLTCCCHKKLTKPLFWLISLMLCATLFFEFFTFPHFKWNWYNCFG